MGRPPPLLGNPIQSYSAPAKCRCLPEAREKSQGMRMQPHPARGDNEGMFWRSGLSSAPLSPTEYRITMWEAKKAGAPIQPPVRPVFQNPAALELLGRLQFFHEDATYRLLLKAEAEGGPSFGFAHRL